MTDLFPNTNLTVFLLFIINFIFFYLLIYLFKNKYPNFLGICESNEKTSLKHQTISRGLGIFYILSLLPFLTTFDKFFDIKDIILLSLTCIIGFWDDKKSLSQILKVSLLSIVVLIYILFGDYNYLTILDIFKILGLLFYFIFLVLFFNQIDGINGLAAITFLITTFLISNFTVNFIFLIPVTGVILSYLFINLSGNIGIQGEAGSFFMGAFVYIISTKSNIPYHYSFTILLLLPLLLDVSSTTIARLILKKNIFKGHRNNLYQKLVAKYKVPSIVSLTFGFIQLAIGVLLIYLIENFEKDKVIIFSLFFIFSLFSIFIKLSFLIHKKQILNN